MQNKLREIRNLGFDVKLETTFLPSGGFGWVIHADNSMYAKSRGITEIEITEKNSSPEVAASRLHAIVIGAMEIAKASMTGERGPEAVVTPAAAG